MALNPDDKQDRERLYFKCYAASLGERDIPTVEGPSESEMHCALGAANQQINVDQETCLEIKEMYNAHRQQTVHRLYSWWHQNKNQVSTYFDSQDGENRDGRTNWNDEWHRLFLQRNVVSRTSVGNRSFEFATTWYIQDKLPLQFKY